MTTSSQTTKNMGELDSHPLGPWKNRRFLGENSEFREDPKGLDDSRSLTYFGALIKEGRIT